MVYPAKTPLIALLSDKQRVSLPGLTASKEEGRRFLNILEALFVNLATIERTALSHFPSMSNYAVIALFDENRSAEIAEDEEYRKQIKEEAARYSAAHKQDPRAPLKIRIHLLNYAHHRFEELEGQTSQHLLVGGDPLRPESLEFSKRRWFDLACKKDSKEQVEGWVKELKQPDDIEMRQVMFLNSRPVLARDFSIPAPPPEERPPTQIEIKAKSYLWSHLSLRSYESIEKKFAEAFPKGVDPTQDYLSSDKHELALRYYFEKLAVICECIRKRYFMESIGKELLPRTLANQTELLHSLETLRKDAIGLKVVCENEMQTNRPKQSSLSALTNMFNQLFSSDKKSPGEEGPALTFSAYSQEWKQFADDLDSLGQVLEVLKMLLATKPLVPAASNAVKIPARQASRKNLRSDLTSQTPPGQHSSMRDPQAPAGPFSRIHFSPRMLADSPRDTALVPPESPKTGSIQSPREFRFALPPHVERSAAAASSSRAIAIPGRHLQPSSSKEGSPRSSVREEEFTPRTSEIRNMVRPSKESPRVFNHLTTLTVGLVNTQEILRVVQSKFTQLAGHKGVFEFIAPHKIHQNENDGIIPIADFKDPLAMACRAYLHEALFYLEKILEALIASGEEKSPRLLLQAYLNHLEAQQAKRFQEVIKPKLDSLKAAFDAEYLEKNGSFKEDYPSLWAWEAWRFLFAEHKAQSPAPEQEGSYTIPLLEDSLERALDQRALRIILNRTLKKEIDPEEALNQFVQTLNQSTLVDGARIQLGASDRNPITVSKSPEGLFWNMFFAYAAQKAKENQAGAPAPTDPLARRWLFIDKIIDLLGKLRDLDKTLTKSLPSLPPQFADSHKWVEFQRIPKRLSDMEQSIKGKLQRIKLIDERDNTQRWVAWVHETPSIGVQTARSQQKIANQLVKSWLEDLQRDALSLAEMQETSPQVQRDNLKRTALIIGDIRKMVASLPLPTSSS